MKKEDDKFPNVNKVATIENILAHQGGNHHETKETLSASIKNEAELIAKAEEYNAVVVYKSPHTKKPGNS